MAALSRQASAWRSNSLVIYSHWTLAPWDAKRWPNFLPHEFACPESGEFYWWPEFFDKIQAVRTALGKPIVINSAHRSFWYNQRIGGAPRSEHKKLALDISLHGHNRFHVLSACRAVGFTGTGYYSTWLHVDMGRKRFWYGSKQARRYWAANDNLKGTLKKRAA